MLSAKKEAAGKNIHWSQTDDGKVAHTWLLGFYDGDGRYRGGLGAEVFAASNLLLWEIQKLFESPNVVRKIRDAGEVHLVFGKPTVLKGYSRLSLGPELFKRMLDAFSQSMRRKRPEGM